MHEVMDDLGASSPKAKLTKWPFYVANALILVIVISFLTEPENSLHEWGIALMVMAVCLSAMLFLIPHLVEHFLAISTPEKNRSSHDDGLQQKTYLELKNFQEIISNFGVKVEKLPAIVEKIAQGAGQGDDYSISLAPLEEELRSLRSQLEQDLAEITESLKPIPTEPDPRLPKLIAQVEGLEESIGRIVDNLAEWSATQPPQEKSEEPTSDEQDDPELETEDNLAKVDRILEETKSTEEEPLNQTAELDLELSDEEEQDEVDEEKNEGELEGEAGDSEEEDEEGENDTEEVDGEEEISADPVGVLKGVSQSDVVVAKFIRGIDNDIFIRGEGPGLSWEEGVSMTFVKVGESSWSPSDKSVPIVVQLFKNDEEPDANGKIELEPGEKVEISPDFAD
uniref:Uncharacterized protein n=1 Tax=uncultured marine microorganism HF4000_APKG3D20 TaxID=455549 RepID=B3T7A7_9ZZZZ|nr:hypothetical protein ALOHA_HF4000APKG3D20ctg1g14 [uncultured marine microorganism HF4000_APKG3D20]